MFQKFAKGTTNCFGRNLRKALEETCVKPAIHFFMKKTLKI
jgi:hypothetical protein